MTRKRTKKEQAQALPQEEVELARNTLKLPFRPKTAGQADYIQAMRKNDITLCFGVAGTGKTALGTQYGFQMLMQNKVKKIILSRPVVGVGRTSGFLPGNIAQKMAPFMKPVFEEFENVCSAQDLRTMVNNDKIEILPFEFVRGRNLHNTFILIDEAQNCRRDELWALMTRFGIGSKLVMVGDPTQSDLPEGNQGGIEYFAKVFRDFDGIGIVQLSEDDIVRSEMVKRMMIRLREYEAA